MELLIARRLTIVRIVKDIFGWGFSGEDAMGKYNEDKTTELIRELFGLDEYRKVKGVKFEEYLQDYLERRYA